MIRRLAAGVACAAIFAWMLPLGSFIKPSQEKTACGGKRAFHMCSMMKKAAAERTEGRVVFTNGSGAQNNPLQGSGGPEDWLLPRALPRPRFEKSFYSMPRIFFPKSYFLFPNTPPPKAKILF